MDDIKKLVRKLFENVVYSRFTERAKEKVSEALQKKYTVYLENFNEIESMGYLMSEYGTIEKALQLAGYTKDDMEEWEKDALVDKNQFQLFFRKVRWIIYSLALSLTLTLEAFMKILVYGKWIHYAGAFAGIIFTSLCFLLFQKKKCKICYQTKGYSKNARIEIDRMFDRYAKRLLNSVHYLIAGFFVEVYFFVTSMIQMNMTPSEAFLSLFSSSVPIGLLTYILLKNIFCKIAIDEQYNEKVLREYRSYFYMSVRLSLVYWLCVVGFVLMTGKAVKMPVELMVLSIIVYFILVMGSNLSLRKAIVFSNITFNFKRIVLIGVLTCSVLSYQLMKMNTFILQPYISMVQPVAREKDSIGYCNETGVYTITTEKNNFRILQLTDIHLGGSAASVGKDYQALKTCKELIHQTKPDFVVVTGDLSFPLGVMSFSFNNTTPIIEFANFMRNIGVPWAFTYGNHDTERVASGSVEEVAKTFESVSYRSSENLLYPYIQPDITGRNNQLLEIRDEEGNLKQALFLLDSNDYIDGMNDYDYIHDDQVAWYRSQIERLNEREGKTISSLLFFHMPLQEYKKANDLYEAGSDQVTYYFGENKEKTDGKVCCSKYPSKLFETAKKLGSTKAMFCGHDHYNNLSLEYEGIRLTYGMSIDYLAMPGIDKDTAQRGATLITLKEGSSYEIQQIPYKKSK